jgi:hypothetical protein
MTDISATLAPDSDQLDAIDLATSGPRTFTVAKVVVRESKKKGDQPVDVHLVEFPRIWRPGKSMRRVLASCWGVDSSAWTGHRVRLYCDPKVRFGDELVGGTRVSHLSHIDSTRSVPLIVTRGKSAMFKVEPLRETDDEKRASFKDAWRLTTDPDVRAAIEAQVAALQQPAEATDPGSIETPEPDRGES